MVTVSSSGRFMLRIVFYTVPSRLIDHNPNRLRSDHRREFTAPRSNGFSPHEKMRASSPSVYAFSPPSLRPR
jgi:hypothetical protein